jgi:hypothetical protein
MQCSIDIALFVKGFIEIAALAHNLNRGLQAGRR